MRKLRADFATKSSEVRWYDLNDDWSLIEASLAKQYGIRIRHHTDMSWSEFCNLVGGIMPDTPLGQIVTIRSESDPQVIKQFNPHQKKIHSDWKLKQVNNKLTDISKYEQDMVRLEDMFSKMFGGGSK